MKLNITTIAFICFTIFSCTSNENKNEKPEALPPKSIDTLTSSSNSSDSVKTIINRPMIWTVDDVNTETGKLKKPENIRLDTLSSSHLIQLINNNFPDIHIDLVKISHDTMYVKIPDSKKLTQGIGNTGAEDYMASATFTLTEFKNIKFISFDMKEGDHAGPGVFSREDFKRLR